MAPEIWLDKPCTKKSDIWALGVILHELCSLIVPFTATDIDELEQKVLHQKPNALPSHVHKSFTAIINKCLIKKPELRPTIEEIILIDDFQEKCKLLKIRLPIELSKAKQAKKIVIVIDQHKRNLSTVDELP